MASTATESTKPLPLWLALLPVLVLIALLAAAIVLFGDDSIGGPAQLSLLIAGCIGGAVGIWRGISWSALEAAVAQMLAKATLPILILLSIGGLIGAWMAAGIIPTLILYGSQILAPQIFYLATLLISAAVALVIGSSWTTAGTVGVALVGVATASGLSLPVTAGAVISGVYFGDKLSPLSDTTNLAAALSGTGLFVHVRYMLWTTLPALLVAALFFGAMSISSSAEVDSAGLAAMTASLQNHYTISAWLLLPMLLMFVMAYRGVPALVTIIISIFLGVAAGVLVGNPGLEASGPRALLTLYWGAIANGFTIATGSALADDLLSRGGMESMLNTVWIIISAMFFSGMMERSGCLLRLLESVIGFFKRDRSILFGVGSTAILSNALTSDQYVSLIIASRMYAGEVERRGLAPETLSRTSEDFGTVTSPLIPWNTCGAFMAGTLGVPTLVYLPYCIFNLASPLISSWYIASGRTLRWQHGKAADTLPATAASA